jgi:hypothetical protein
MRSFNYCPWCGELGHSVEECLPFKDWLERHYQAGRIALAGSVAQPLAPHHEHIPFKWRYEGCNVISTGPSLPKPPVIEEGRAKALKEFEEFMNNYDPNNLDIPTYMLPWDEWTENVRLTGIKVEVPYEINDIQSRKLCTTMRPEVLQYFAAKNPDHPPGYPIKHRFQDDGQYIEGIPIEQALVTTGIPGLRRWDESHLLPQNHEYHDPEVHHCNVITTQSMNSVIASEGNIWGDECVVDTPPSVSLDRRDLVIVAIRLRFKEVKNDGPGAKDARPICGFNKEDGERIFRYQIMAWDYDTLPLEEQRRISPIIRVVTDWIPQYHDSQVAGKEFSLAGYHEHFKAGLDQLMQQMTIGLRLKVHVYTGVMRATPSNDQIPRERMTDSDQPKVESCNVILIKTNTRNTPPEERRPPQENVKDQDTSRIHGSEEGRSHRL